METASPRDGRLGRDAGISSKADKLEVTCFRPGVVVHAFNPSTQEAEAGGFL